MLPPQSGFVQEGPCQICAKSWPRWGSTARVGRSERNTASLNGRTLSVQRAAGGRVAPSLTQGSDRHGRSLSFPCLVRIFRVGV